MYILVYRYNNKKLLYYFLFFIITILFLVTYLIADTSTSHFKMRDIYYSSAGLIGMISITPILFSFILFSYTHFLIKQQEKNHAN
ncbi:hypothetical protein [uncultured Gammaproteobacteria bacterium]|jgi:hypothetical protein|nr:hypothetical protein [uncultured Gammaproteobacteria bacterium]CAC9577113.1 hypothetical protein [uncultured Gammaproteobacteria bacterium]CAC9580855.1 hypothetical protein [uncultured Gammaproteobacteria bacterium]CAC9581156.1 hypothetical protein [uncultured Gammaproteobacteria bacterium]CAC9605351.1 hypothetical protein [uncultured Gammaproteobacteria bacterium]